MPNPFTVIDDNMKLQICFTHNQPIQLSSLCQSLEGVAKEYSSFIQLHSVDKNIEPCDNNIYVTQITKGSIIIELAAYIAATYTLFEHSNAIFEFGENIKRVYEWLQNKGARPDNITAKQLRNLSQTLEPVVNDPNASVQINSINIAGDVNLILKADSTLANAMQNRINKTLSEMKEPITGFHKNCAMIWAVTSSNKPVDKAVIEMFSKKSVKVFFDNEQLKETMVMREHPYKHIFVVDVVVHTVNDNPVLYHIKQLNEILDKE